MPNETLTGARYPAGSDSPNIAQYIQNAVADLADNTIPDFTTTTARDSAYASWVASGNSMRTGLVCAVGNAGHYEYVNGSWLPFRGAIAATSETTTVATTGTAEARMAGGHNVTAVTLVTGRAYEAVHTGIMQSITNGGSVVVRLRASASGTPTTTSPVVSSSQQWLTNAGGPGAIDFRTSNQLFQVGASSSAWQIHAFGEVRSGGASAVQVTADARGVHTVVVYDRGPAPAGLRTI